MPTSNISSSRSFLFISFLSILLVFVLAGCGSNTSSGGAGTTPSTPTPTTIKGYGTDNGCPSDLVVNPATANANVKIQANQANSTVTVQNGDVIAILLPFGQKWSGPTTSQGQLALQNPSGYAVKTDKTCVWRFVAQGTGTTTLSFRGQAICKSGGICPQYILNVPFTIVVK